MTRKKQRPVKSIDKLSDDLKGQRALKGSNSVLVVTISSFDRWIAKAEHLEQARERLIKSVLDIGASGLNRESRLRDVEELQKRLRDA